MPAEPAAGEEPAKLYAAIPALPGEDGVVWVLDADFTAASTPLFRMDLYPPVGGVLPRPSGVTIDADAKSYFPTLFGRGGYAIVTDLAALPAALPGIYRQVTR